MYNRLFVIFINFIFFLVITRRAFAEIHQFEGAQGRKVLDDKIKEAIVWKLNYAAKSTKESKNGGKKTEANGSCGEE